MVLVRSLRRALRAGLLRALAPALAEGASVRTAVALVLLLCRLCSYGRQPQSDMEVGLGQFRLLRASAYHARPGSRQLFRDSSFCLASLSLTTSFERYISFARSVFDNAVSGFLSGSRGLGRPSCCGPSRPRARLSTCVCMRAASFCLPLVLSFLLPVPFPLLPNSED